MSGEVRQNTSVATGVIATAPSATESASNPLMTTNPEDVGAEWHNTTSGEIFICWDNTAGLNKWKGQKGNVVQPARGIFWSGTQTAPDADSNIIDYITIDSLGDATDFGDAHVKSRTSGTCSNGVTGRGVKGGGNYGVVIGNTDRRMDDMEYITIDSAGNAADFGNLTQIRSQVSAVSNASDDRGVWGGGYAGSTVNTLDYVTISSAANAVDFGNASTVMQDNSATSNGTNERGVFFSGNRTSNYVNIIDYITIDSAGNATDFGDTLAGVAFSTACSNQTNERGICFAGNTSGGSQDVIQYITINSTGNAADFGDALAAMYGAAGTSNGTGERGVIGGGYPGGVNHNVIQYITINSAGDAADFGDLTEIRSMLGACSNAG